MINPNQIGMIYYGTNICYLEEIDYCGIEKPRFRDEQYLSVSISGYRGFIPCKHPELQEMARIFSEELNVASYKDGYLKYHEGYINSLTCFQGFGVCPNSYLHTYEGLIPNRTNNEKLTVVISNKASSYLVFPDKENTFEYLSLAIHSFLKKLRPEDIVGYITSSHNREYVQDLIKNKKIKNHILWTEKYFDTLSFVNPDDTRYKVNIK